MNSALQLLSEFEVLAADGFPLGEQGAEVLDHIERVSKLVEETKAFYKAQLARDLHCVPGWTLNQVLCDGVWAIPSAFGRSCKTS